MPDQIARPPLSGAGCFGKLPTLGDFVTRRLPREFVDPWDAWLRQALARSREQLRAAWLEVYLISPVWCFALSPGICGPRPWAGVTIPSVDSVGRYFPFTLAAPLPTEALPLWTFHTQGPWFEAAQTLALTALGTGFELARFEQDLSALQLPIDGSEPPPPRPTADPARGPSRAWHLTGPVTAEHFSSASPALLESILADVLDGYSIWWTTSGSAKISPSLLLTQGLPPIDGYVSLLQGDWAERSWRPILRWTIPGSTQPKFSVG